MLIISPVIWLIYRLGKKRTRTKHGDATGKTEHAKPTLVIHSLYLSIINIGCTTPLRIILSCKIFGFVAFQLTCSSVQYIFRPFVHNDSIILATIAIHLCRGSYTGTSCKHFVKSSKATVSRDQKAKLSPFCRSNFKYGLTWVRHFVAMRVI